MAEPDKDKQARPEAEAYEAISRSAHLSDLVAIARTILTEAAVKRPSGWNYVDNVGAAADAAKLARSDADTPFGNVLKVLGTGPEGDAERALASAIWAHAIAEIRDDDNERLAGDILWLATHSAFDATPLIDRALGEDSEALWKAIGARVRKIDAKRGTAIGRGEALVGVLALTASESEGARKVRDALASELTDPMLARILADSVKSTAATLHLQGEAIAGPRGPVVTTLLAMTGILFVARGLRLLAGLTLAYRRPAEIWLSDAGIRMKVRTEMLGRTLREREHVIVRSGLVRVVRDVRYPRAAFYAGLLALAVGSYVGVRTLTDGVRAASPSLLATGLVLIVLGIAMDFVLGTLIPGTRKRVRISFVPRTGQTLCLANVDANHADAALKQTLQAIRG